MLSFFVGLTAGTICCLSFIPQVVKIYQTKTAGDLSFVTFSVLASGVSLWLVYGLMVKDFAIIFANIVTLILLLVILVLKIKYDHCAKRGDA